MLKKRTCLADTFEPVIPAAVVAIPVLVIIFALLFPSRASGAELWGFFPVASYHFGDSACECSLRHKSGDSNEFNYGFGLQVRRDNQDSVNVGAYRNSFYRDSQYALYGFDLRSWYPSIGRVRFEWMIGGITGYGHNPSNLTFYAAPVVSIERETWGVSLLWVPTVVAAIGFKAKFKEF